MLQRIRILALPWSMLLLTAMLSAAGLMLVTSATWDPDGALGMGREARLQAGWLATAAVAAVVCAHVRFAAWRELAWPLYIIAVAVLLVMLAAAGTALVPKIKGQANWIAIGSWRIQPIEFVKIATLLALARFCSAPWFDARRLGHTLLALAVGLLPAALVAKEDLGSALTMGPMVIAVLLVCGMRLRLVAIGAALAIAAAAAGIALLPRDGYQWKRIQAWRDPEAYALHEGYQTIRGIRSIGSGQLTGKGFAMGDQNRLGQVPEKHTDMILAVAGEETGFLGTVLLVFALIGFGLACLWTASRCADPTARLTAAGLGCLVVGQASINISVATGLIPVTGVTLPFISYGGSSLLALYIGLGIVAAACSEQAATSRLSRPRPLWARR